MLNNFGSTYASPFDAEGGVVISGTAADQAIAAAFLAGNPVGAPEPASLGLVAAAIGVLAFRRRGQ